LNGGRRRDFLRSESDGAESPRIGQRTSARHGEPSMTSWILSLAVGLAAVILTAGAGRPLMNLGAAGVVSLAFAALAVMEHRQLAAAKAPDAAIAASDARYMGLVWSWGALALIAVYNFVLKWPEWWMFFAGFAAAAVMSLFLSTVLERDAARGSQDETMLKLARILGGAQAIGMVATVAGLVVDGKMTRYLNPAKYPDWVANNVFFCGAIALLVISAFALWPRGKSQPAGA
jgi:hypothetical protein